MRGPSVTRWGLCVLLLGGAGWACETTSTPGGFQKDLIPPAISLTTANDTQPIASGLSLTVDATDNLALNDVRLIFSGGLIDTIDTIFRNQTLATVTLPVSLTFPANSGAGGNIRIIGRATDGAGNFAEDTIFIFLSNVKALKVYLNAPAPGATTSPGKSFPVEVSAAQLSGIRKVGFLVSPPAAVTNPTIPPNDSIFFALPYSDSVDYTDTLTVSPTFTTGVITITGFAEDSSGRRSTTSPVTVAVQSAANDVTPPSVTDSVAARVEVSDTVVVHATDPSGISWMGFRVRDPNTLAVIEFDTVNVGGALTDVVRHFSLQLATLISTFPSTVLIDGYACDAAAARNCAFSTVSGVVRGTPKADSTQIVAGISRLLPAGSQIADAIFDGNAQGGTGELYLTNAPLGRVEIFQVANTNFVAGGIPTAGPQPWGIALWPSDTVGNYLDTLVVADAGGTELSIIDAAARRLRWRQDLPNYEIELYKVINLAEGGYGYKITVYDLSDRPQYVATVCRTGGAPPACATDSIFAIYATTPTASSSTPFDGRGTLRMEKLINSTDTTQLFGHFFWEIGALNSSDVSDTLRVVMRRGRPYNQTKVVLSACAGVTIDFSTFGLGDSTYTRNSGNFTHAFVGEGGNAPAQYRRVMSYTTKDALLHGSPTTTSCRTSPPDSLGRETFDAGDNDEDLGMSPAVDVSDFISNTGVKVASIATNFNGGTNLVRADSMYVLDEGLRLKGASPVAPGAYGMDMNYFHDFLAGQGGSTGLGGTRDSTNRVAFVADPIGNILAFDTFFYNQIGSIPVRDPIIGPLRVAKDASGNQLLFGVTARGVVMVKLPVFPNPNPAPPRLSKQRNR